MAKIEGQILSLEAMTYQGKCLRWLREEFAALKAGDQAVATGILRRTGCAHLIFESLQD